MKLASKLAAIVIAVSAALFTVPSAAQAATTAPAAVAHVHVVTSPHVAAAGSHRAPRTCCYFEWEDFGTYSTKSQCEQAKAIWQPILKRTMRCIPLGIGYVLQQLVMICMSKSSATPAHIRGRALAA